MDGGQAFDAGSPGGGSGLECTFNSDCPLDERCECDEETGCQCLTGARGTGRAGVDPCVSGNDCESALCVEGWNSYYCSGPCRVDTDCGPRLPVCSYIFFLGDACVRDPTGP
ncbi:hypothetical protein [Archangium sp. Cb G35]|uniref:hypothetical protein n=1 Tax=Archangium sp. Cb G35 TaxID=1920190 RepID=UPI000AB63692|nr:hypothetical protein [Archangium sp. Cb G35]